MYEDKNFFVSNASAVKPLLNTPANRFIRMKYLIFGLILTDQTRVWLIK